MVNRSRSPARRRWWWNLLALFGVTILLPGLLLAVVGVRALLQERRYADQQLRERLDRAADIAASDLERELADWRSWLDRAPRAEGPDLTAVPERLRQALTAPGAGAIVWLDRARRRIWPEQQALFDPWPTPTPAVAQLEDGLVAAESAELRDKDYPRAIRLYREAAATRNARSRAAALHRLARTLRKAGRTAEAMDLYRELAASTEWIGALPAALIAKHETCSLLASQGRGDELGQAALELYGDLVSGRWLLEPARYEYYAANARQWLSGHGAHAAGWTRWEAVEGRKRSLTAAAAALTDGSSGQASSSAGPFVVVRSSVPGAALLLARSWLAADVWPGTFKPALGDGLDVTLLGPGGDAWFVSRQLARGEAAPPLAATRMAADGQWRVRVTPRDPAAFSADVARRQSLYLVMLVLVVALLGFGSYLTTRVVRKELEIARLKSDFVATVSHEFRSPLTGIRQLGELLMRGRVASEERRQEYYERITRESDRLSRLVENLLDFARMEDGRKQYRFERLDTRAFLHAVVEEARTERSNERPAIVEDIPAALPPILGDQAALGCAVRNLIDNAVKYSPGREAVWLEAEAQNGSVTIRVRDRGVGMSDEDRRHVFEKFYRGEADITRRVKGAGLGLSLVEHIVGAHGGTLYCDSRLGEGSTFSIRLNAMTDPGGA